MQSTSLPAATKDQSARMVAIVDIGCLCCLLKTGCFHTPAEIHHLLDNGRRISHSHTVALCAWHHRGQRETERSERFTRNTKGPSLAKDPEAFIEEFGSDEDLLSAQNVILERYLKCYCRDDEIPRLVNA